ncbi:MAG: RNA polymerase Rpb4 family protein [archaeon]
MPRRIVTTKEISLPEAKRVLEKVEPEELGEFQRRTSDYVTKFSKVSASRAERAIGQLVSKFNLERGESIQIVNCMPETREELRAVLSSKGRVIATSQLDGIIGLLQSIRKE